MCTKSFTVASGGAAACLIIYEMPEYTRAGEILAAYLKKITGAEIPVSQIKPDLQKSSQIILQKEDYGASGFAIRIEDENLLICAENEQSAVYGVYDLLEKHAGCRFFTSSVDIPSIPELALAIVAYQYVPVLKFRELYYKDYENKDFAEKHKLSPSEQHEGWGFWCHTFNILLPPDLYDEHPEYFALVDGERKRNAQPCLSNPEVYTIIRDNLKLHMVQKPEDKYWSVSQDDNA